MTQAILAKSLIINNIRIILTLRALLVVNLYIDVPHCVSITMHCRQRKGHFVGDDGQKQDNYTGFKHSRQRIRHFLRDNEILAVSFSSLYLK